MEKFKGKWNTPFSVILEHTLNVNHLSNVILGFIPRIHAKHYHLLDTRDRLFVTPEYDKNLRVDSRVKPETDYKLSLTKGLDVVRQCAETFKRRVQKEYTSAKISSRHQLNEFSQNNLRPQCAPDTTGFLSDVYKRSTRAQKFLVDGVQCGRSMIEMLGVLAIIGVLSVGGIQGFSKAMREYRSNQQKQQLSQIFANTISLRSSIGSYPETMENITYVLDALNEIPDGLTYKNSRLIDNYGNLIELKHGLSKWTNEDGSQSHQYYYLLSLNFSQTNTLLSPSGEDFCKNALQTIKAFRADISAVCFHISDSTTWNGGASYCTSGQQLTDDVSSPVKVQQTCQFCNKPEKGCLFNIVFDMSN